jgi:uncharacterized membrane protein YraQ (UPF0718 family)
MTESLITSGKFFIKILLELIPLFFLITFLSGLILEYVSPEMIRNVLGGKRGTAGRLAAIFLGFVTPFCSCSTIPMLAGMVGAGVPVGILTTFLFASPYPVEIAILVLGPLFGWVFAIAFFVAGGVIAYVAGLLVDRAGWDDQVKEIAAPPVSVDDIDLDGITLMIDDGFWAKMKRAWHYAVDFFKGVAVYIVVGSAVGALIYGFLPENFIVQYAGGASLVAVPIAALIGAPLYLSAAAVIPIIYSLSLKGMNNGAIIAFLITATSISPPELIMLASLFKRKYIITYILTMILGAVITGYLLNLIV